MAEEEEKSAVERAERGIGGAFRLVLAFLILVGVVVGWGWLGGFFVQLQPGEAAVILRLGAYERAIFEPGIHFHMPYPIEAHHVVNFSEVRREKFGYSDVEEAKPGAETATFETAIQTADNNIVNLSYVIQYKIRDPFAYVLGMEDPASLLRDAAQSAVREVVGRRQADQVLSSDRGGVQNEAKKILQTKLDSYFDDPERSAFDIRRVELQVVQPPTPVQAAFDDVVAAQQDDQRAVAEARGDSREILERASAEASEIREQATAFKDAKVLEAKGEAQRFVALLEEYKRAPDVTRRRLYLETMEQILPEVEKVIIEPDAANLMPFFPLEGSNSRLARGRSSAAGAAAGGAAE